MRIELLTFGKPKETFIQDGLAFYAKKIQHFSTFSHRILKPETLPKKTNAQDIEKALKVEAQIVQKAVTGKSILIALDRGGKSLTSEGLADQFRDLQHTGKSNLFFLIGSAHGIDPELLKTCAQVISLSKLTLQHDLAALMLMEQIYRAFSILKGTPYHK